MKTILTIILALFLLGCGEDDMAHIGVEVPSDLIDTNVTDDTQVYDTTKTTLSAHNGDSSFIIINGTLWATGDNSSGNLGLGDNVNRNVFTNTGLTDVSSVYSGLFHTFALKSDGTLWATGDNSSGNLGLGDNVNRNVFVNIGIDGVKSIAIGHYFSVLIKTDGTLWSTGRNQYGELGLGNQNAVSSFTNTGVANVKLCSVGIFHTVILKSDGTLWATGQNYEGQLGIETTVSVNSFTKIPSTNLDSVINISAGGYTTFALKSDGTLWATGKNYNGELGVNDNINKNSYTNTNMSNVSGIFAGGFHTALIKSGVAWMTGKNSSYQLGLGDNTDRNIFVNTGVSAKNVSAGLSHTVILKADGTIWATGDNSLGQGGLGLAISVGAFTDTGNTADTYVAENWSYFYQGDTAKVGDYIYNVSLLTDTTPSIFVSLAKIGYINQLKPFDGQNITPAISSSLMIYKIEGTKEFNAFTLAKVLATSITYTFRDKLDNIVKTEEVAIDCKRDKDGILSLYPTTVVYYAGQQMEAGSTVEIELTHDEDIELGDFTLNNMIDSGFTNLSFGHGIQDFNNYTPDPWGNIPESVKAIVTTFNVSMDVFLTNYDYAVSFNESIAGKNVTIDASDSNGVVADGKKIFSSLTRRVRVISPAIKSNVKDEDLGKMATLTMKVQEIA